MKKMIAVVLSLLMVLSLAACGNSDDPQSPKTMKIAIVQQLDHSSLDEIRMAIEAEFAATNYDVKVYNGQNDASVMNQIGTEIMSEGFDAISAMPASSKTTSQVCSVSAVIFSITRSESFS